MRQEERERAKSSENEVVLQRACFTGYFYHCWCVYEHPSDSLGKALAWSAMVCEMGIVLPETVNSRTTGFYDSMTSVLWRMLNGWMQPLTFDLLRQKCVGFFCFVFVFGCKLLLLQKSAYILITFSLKWICLQNSPW